MATSNDKLPKQYPDLMAGKTILYVHGFGSSAQSGTVTRLQTTLPNATVKAYDLPIHPEEAMLLLREVCQHDKPHLIIGTSMGGMYAEMLYGYDRILVNPAFEMGDTMHEHNMMGKQTFYNPRADGVQDFIVTKALVKEYKEITMQCFAQITETEQQKVWGLFGDNDPVVHTFDLFRRHYPQALHFKGEHRLDDSALFHGVLPVIRWIDDRQENRRRNIVYIHASTFEDGRGMPRASFNKAVDLLTEQYRVFFVAPSPTNEPTKPEEVTRWLERYAGTVAHNNVVFTNHPELLYGDYLISATPIDDALCTTLTLGSDDMKTWDEVITFFSRLGGQ